MKISIFVPAADMKRHAIYRFINRVYGPSSSITGPLILGGILKNAGHKVSVYEELEEDVNLQEVANADVIGIYTMTSNVIRAYKCADYFRSQGKKVILGGLHASALPEEALKHADQIVVGEAESVILDCVEGRINDKIVHAKPVMDLDCIPLPDYSVLRTKTRAANVLTSRGCPNNCSFCTTTRMFNPYRKRSISNILDEIRLYKSMGFRYCNFQDDNLTAEPERIKILLRSIIKEKLFFKDVFFFGRVDLAEDDELLDLLYEARFRRVLIGFESLNQNSLEIINKQTTVGDIKNAASRLRSKGIKVIASLVMGIDSDTPDDIRKSVDFCIDSDAYQLQNAILTPYPGTADWDRLKNENRILTEDWQHYDMVTTVFRPKHYTPWELQKELFDSICRFYTIRSIPRIAWLFGLSAAVRRIGLWLIMRVARIYFHFKSRLNDGNIYHWQKNIDNTSAVLENMEGCNEDI